MYAYGVVKIFVMCTLIGGSFVENIETTETKYFARNEIPENLANEKVTREQNIINLNACIAYTETEDEHLTNDSVNYHEHLGYSLVGTFHKCGYKFGKWYDMVWMEKMLGEHPDKPLAVVGFPKIKKFKSSQNLHKKISTHILTVLTIWCITQIVNGKRYK